MRRWIGGIVVCLVAGLPAAAQSAEPNSVAAGLERLDAELGADLQVRHHRATGAARFVRFENADLALDGATAADRGRSFFARHGRAFGVIDATAQLRLSRSAADRFGQTHVIFEQRHRGLPVFAGELRTHFDARGRLSSVNGTFVPDIDIDTHPVWQPGGARVAALGHVRAQTGDGDPALAIRARGARLLIYREGLARGVPGRNNLAYEVEVGDGAQVREFVYVDAHTGKVIETLTGIHEALDRRVHEPRLDDVEVWSEGDTLPYDTGDGSNDDQVNGLIDQASTVYDLFSHLSAGAYVSWDGADATLHSVWKAAGLNCPNATWNGTSTNYCDGVASDDVAAHEWTHAYTERTHGLIYAWQPGALNESYSDIFGELVDLLNGTGTDSPAPVRVGGECSTFGGSPPPSVAVSAPAAIAGGYAAAGASFNPAPPLSASGAIERVDDGDDEGGSASVHDGCQSFDGFTPGNIALADRGACSFSTKAQNAENAGAVALIVVNSGDGTFNMGGSGSFSFPSVMIGSSDGDRIEAEPGGGVNASIDLAAATDSSLRWLIGEDSFSFGGPIRDMWNPTCLGDPGKVSDFQYACSPADNGGVHTNSGVPNHAFALLVDGGSYNGRTVAALGATRAANLYWRAMSVYQMRDSDFTDHADALTQSCTDLLGLDLPSLSDGSPSGETMTAADCQAVAQALLAVELADDPPCGFAPLLAPDPPPAVCGTELFVAGFDADPTADWSRSNSGVFAEYSPRDWEWTSDLPPGGNGSAFFAVSSPSIGNCIEGDDDQSGSMNLDSPVVNAPGPMTLAFDHYVATEPQFDGGNLKIRVNGAAFEPVDPADFSFNAYNTSLVAAADGNTNPLAGEPAFTGTDGGQVHGSWGQSQVDLSGYAGAGDAVELRFEMGVDGCNGIDGWYVDNVRVCSTSPLAAGRVPSDSVLTGGPSLTVEPAPGGKLSLAWGASCTATDVDYEIYEGTIGDFTSHVPRHCGTGGLPSASVLPSAGDTYYLVVPRNSSREGSYGTDSDGSERPAGAGACLVQSIAASCP